MKPSYVALFTLGTKWVFVERTGVFDIHGDMIAALISFHSAKLISQEEFHSAGLFLANDPSYEAIEEYLKKNSINLVWTVLPSVSKNARGELIVL